MSDFNGFPNKLSTEVITNNGFFPDVSVGEFQDRYRMPSSYTDRLIIDHLVSGICWANKQLAEYQITQVGEGHTTLAEVPADTVNNISIQEHYYFTAVCSYAKATLMQSFKTVNRRSEAKNEARESEDTEAKFMQYAGEAISDFLDKPRITVALI
ncbi:MAG: head completion/stabilization protein [Desulfovibrio sp.]